MGKNRCCWKYKVKTYFLCVRSGLQDNANVVSFQIGIKVRDNSDRNNSYSYKNTDYEGIKKKPCLHLPKHYKSLIPWIFFIIRPFLSQKTK